MAVSFEEYDEKQGRGTAVNAAPVGPRDCVLLSSDVTERRRRDAALQRTEKLAAVGRMASSISHEINNPLESVTNLLYLIQHGDSDHEDMRTYAQLAASELSRVSHIVTQTLKFHRQSTHAALCRGLGDSGKRGGLVSEAGSLRYVRLIHRKINMSRPTTCLAIRN